jgi:hypothetical protein
LNIDGMLWPGGNVKASRITDGTSKTFMVGERWYQFRVWTAGNYWSIGMTVGFGTVAPKFGPLGNASSSAKNISWNIPPNADLNVVGYYSAHDNTIDRPPKPDGAPGGMAYNNFPFASFHKGITNFVRADGGTESVTDNIDPQVYTAYASRNGDEVFNAQQ